MTADGVLGDQVTDNPGPDRSGAQAALAGAPDVAPEDVLRANTYALLAVLLHHQPDDAALAMLTDIESDETEFGQALGALADRARAATVDTVDDEFHDLFLGIGEAELKPYASYYLTGFLYEKPLAKLRADMCSLGVGKADDATEPEDHIAALCEMMCGMIMGDFGVPVPLDRQRAFFDQHIGPWAGRFFENLEDSPNARFYKPVGIIGRLFMTIEKQSFEMAA